MVDACPACQDRNVRLIALDKGEIHCCKTCGLQCADMSPQVAHGAQLECHQDGEQHYFHQVSIPRFENYPPYAEFFAFVQTSMVSRLDTLVNYQTPREEK